MRLFLYGDLLLPLLPACPYLLDLLFIGHHMHRYDVTRDGAGIGQTRQSRTIEPCKRHNETMTDHLWTGGNRARADSLLQRNIGHHNLCSEGRFTSAMGTMSR